MEVEENEGGHEINRDEIIEKLSKDMIDNPKVPLSANSGNKFQSMTSF